MICSIPRGSFGEYGYVRRTSELPNIARIGALIGNPVRAQFIGALMDGGVRSFETTREAERQLLRLRNQ
jgi:hypothetical protein